MKLYLKLILIGFVIGVFFSLLFTGCDSNWAAKTSVIATKDLKKKADSVEKTYLAEIEVLRYENAELLHELNLTNGLLTISKQITAKTETKIKTFIAGRPDTKKIKEPEGFSAEKLLQTASVSNKKTDSLSPCDSLVTLASDYIDQNHQKDSLYEAKISSQDSLLFNKDSIIQINATVYNSLNQLFSQSLINQESLHKENKRLQRKYKRQRLKNKLITVGLMIFSGFAANNLSHH